MQPLFSGVKIPIEIGKELNTSVVVQYILLVAQFIPGSWELSTDR